MNFGNELRDTRIFFKEKIARIMGGVAILFFGFCILSAWAAHKQPVMAASLLADFQESMKDVIDEGQIDVIKLFLNNLFACGIGVGMGIIPFLFLPIVSVLSNGSIIGVLLGYGSATGQFTVWKAVVFGMVPHGIFEIPAMLLSMSLGFYLCKTFTMRIVSRNKAYNILEALNHIARTFVIIIIPLLIVAAAVEAYVTPLLTAYM